MTFSLSYLLKTSFISSTGMFIDLTLPIDKNSPVLPGYPPVGITQFATLAQNGWNEKQLVLTSHCSTHIDAPNHMLEIGKTLSDYPIESFMGEAIILDVRGQSEIKVDVSEVKRNDIVFFYTGHNDRLYEKDYFKNNPVISKKTTLDLIKKKICFLGIDSFTPDNEPYLIHKLLFEHDIRIVENLIHLDKINRKRFYCYIFPLNIKDADGAPCRVVAKVC
ncbi:MAG: cyclase family protein [Candidatus Thermoplasmatota archaeon]|nr:cyclase family protein [Candidatus Thermoplasmatota archaeon]